MSRLIWLPYCLYFQKLFIIKFVFKILILVSKEYKHLQILTLHLWKELIVYNNKSKWGSKIYRLICIEWNFLKSVVYILKYREAILQIPATLQLVSPRLSKTGFWTRNNNIYFTIHNNALLDVKHCPKQFLSNLIN